MSSWADLSTQSEEYLHKKMMEEQRKGIPKVDIPSRSQLLFPIGVRFVPENVIMETFCGKPSKVAPVSTQDSGRPKRQNQQANRRSGGNKSAFDSVVGDSTLQVQVQAPQSQQQKNQTSSSNKFSAYRPNSSESAKRENSVEEKPPVEDDRQRRNRDTQRKFERDRQRRDERKIEESTPREVVVERPKKDVEVRVKPERKQESGSNAPNSVAIVYKRELSMLDKCKDEQELKEMVEVFRRKHSDAEFDKFFDYVYGCNEYASLRNKLYMVV